MRTKILIIILTLFTSSIIAQEEDLIESKPLIEKDTALENSVIQSLPKVKIPFKQKIKLFPSKVNQFFNDETPKPKKALWMTFVLPGSGQAYNNKHWKIPIVYVGIGTLSYAIAFNTRNYRRYKTAYIARLDDDETTIEGTLTASLSNSVLQTVRDGYRNDLERSYLGMIGFYALVGIDAFVDAHLQNFDVNDDLSWQLKPSFQNQQWSTNPSAGMTFSLTFGNRDQYELEVNDAFEEVKNASLEMRKNKRNF